MDLATVVPAYFLPVVEKVKEAIEKPGINPVVYEMTAEPGPLKDGYKTVAGVHIRLRYRNAFNLYGPFSFVIPAEMPEDGDVSIEFINTLVNEQVTPWHKRHSWVIAYGWKRNSPNKEFEGYELERLCYVCRCFLNAGVVPYMY